MSDTQTKKSIDLDELIDKPDQFYARLDSLTRTVKKKYKQRRKIVSFKINDEVYDCSIANLITQMVLLIPFVDMQMIPSSDFIILDEIRDFNADTFENWANRIIDEFINNKEFNDGNIQVLNMSFKKVIENLANNSGVYNILSGTTISLYSLLMLYANNDEFRKLVDTKIEDNDFSQINKDIDEKFGKIMDILRNEDTPYRVYFRSKTGINEKQFKEVMGTIGLKTDLDGIIIPYIIQNNYFKGLESIVEFFINALMARKALITSHQKVKDSGYFTRKLSMLLIDTQLSDVDDCGTDEYVTVNVEDKKTLGRLNLRYYLNKKGKLSKINSSKDKDLIGETLLLRSPIKCKCKNGVCKKCYGDLWKVNKNIHIGIEAILEMTEQFTQKLLSAKHLQQTIVDIINWSNNFLENFDVDKGFIYIDLEKEKSGSRIIIDDEWLMVDDENNYQIQQFIIKAKNGKEVNIPLPDNINVLLSDNTKELITNDVLKDDEGRYNLPFKMLIESSESPVFQFEMVNNELSSTLQSMINLIEQSEHPDPLNDMKPITNIDILANRFLSLLNNGGVHLAAVHAELILRSLVRDNDDLTIRPERFDDEKGYTILKVSDGVINSESSAPSLSFEELKKQIQTPNLYFKNGQSILDVLFFQ